MPLCEDLLIPIPGDNPSGVDLRYDSNLLIYDKIREARRKDDDLAQGDWQHERKVANYPLVIKLAQESLTSVSKDLQLSAWLTEALLSTQGFSGLLQGLLLCKGLLTTFWDTLYPLIEEDDKELRVKPLAWIGSMLDITAKMTPIVSSGYDFLKYKESRTVGYEDQAKTEKEKKDRAKTINEGKLAPEVFDKAFVETPKAFYLQSEKDLDGCLEALNDLDKLCDEYFGDDAPGFGKLESALKDVRHVVHALLEKKRETEPDPIEPVVETADPPALEGMDSGGSTTSVPVSLLNSFEPSDRNQAVAIAAAVAAYLRKQEPHSPAPYLMLRGLRWGELRAAGNLSDSSLLEAPPTELRQQIKRLALDKKWRELLETGENAMALPCSRAWFDLQRLIVGACTALGDDYAAIAAGVQAELRALLQDMPELLDAVLLDDTPAANAETRAWLRQLGQKAPTTPVSEEEAGQTIFVGQPAPSSWLAPAADAYALAKEALKMGQEEKAFTIMRKEIARQRSGRGRFERTIQLIELCSSAGKDAIAQPLLEDIAAAIENHKLDAWEEPEMVAASLVKLMKMSERVQASSSEKQKLFERICRLDPVQALSAG